MQLLAFGIVPDDQRGVAAVDAADVARRTWLDQHGDESLDDVGIYDLLRTGVETTIADATLPLLIGVTSGFDSRPLLHLVKEMGRKPLLFCYSQPGNIDHDVAMWLDARLGLGVQLCDTRTMPFSLEIYESHARTQNPSPIGAGAPGWAWAYERFGATTLLHGFLNDALTGDNREKAKGAKQLGAREAFMARNNPFGLQSLIDTNLLDELCPGAAVSSDRELDLYSQYDFAYRQESRIKPLPGGPHDVRFAFTDARWVGYWLSRPLGERSGQLRWYEYIKGLKSPLFADLDGLEHLEGKALRLARKRRFYGDKGEPGILDFSSIESPLQKEPAHPFDLVTVHAANPHLRATVSESLHRLRGRGLVYNSVIDAIEHRFARGDQAAGLLVKALVTIDVHVEVAAV